MREEIKKLEEAKEVAEEELEARVPPLNTALQCLTLRERRREGDLVKDEVEVQYMKKFSLLCLPMKSEKVCFYHLWSVRL